MAAYSGRVHVGRRIGGDRVGIRRSDRLLGHHRAVGRDVELTMGTLDIAGLDVRLPRLRAFGDGDVVVGQQGPLGLFQGDDRDVVASSCTGPRSRRRWRTG